ncbi:hypothetical protein ACUTAF_01185 [Pseudomonas sp. SP16.1]|uniref:hypothetical protein n=1 Tax=Pseudomonas sp. SP16.1 TaxID=3458854 RepID=UPI004045CF0A
MSAWMPCLLSLFCAELPAAELALYTAAHPPLTFGAGLPTSGRPNGIDRPERGTGDRTSEEGGFSSCLLSRRR